MGLVCYGCCVRGCKRLWVCMYVRGGGMYVRGSRGRGMYVRGSRGMYVCMYVCMYVRGSVRVSVSGGRGMYVCMYVCEG